MEILKANLHNLDHRRESHRVSLVPTMVRRVVRPIGVGFLPLEKSPGGFCSQVPFRIRFPKPPWNLFYITILSVIALLCPNEVTMKSDRIWEQVVSSNNCLPQQRRLVWRIRQFDQIDPTTISVSCEFLNFNTRTYTLIHSRIFRLFVMDHTFFDEFVEIDVIIALIVTLGLIWRIVIRRFAMFGFFPWGFQIHRNKMRCDLLPVRQVLKIFNERVIGGDLYCNIGSNILEICQYVGQWRILTQWLDDYEFTEIKEIMVANEQRCIRRFKKHGQDPFQTTYHTFLSIKMMRTAFRSFIYMVIACYECMKRGLNRFILLPVRLLLESRVTSTSSSKLGFNFLYLFQRLYLNGHVSCKLFMQ